MDALVEVKVSPCPNCGENRWLMKLPEDVAREKHAKLVEDAPAQAFRRGSLWGWLLGGGVLSRLVALRVINDFFDRKDRSVPQPSETTLVCANCGREMGLDQGSQASHDWRFG